MDIAKGDDGYHLEPEHLRVDVPALPLARLR